jgi:hypothetical protein
MMHNVRVYLKGMRDGRLYADAVNDSRHPAHDDMYEVYLQSYKSYKPGERTYFGVEYDDEGTDNEILNRAFDRFNMGDPRTDEAVDRYRRAGCRSLSVGDVVIIDDRAFTCASLGWERVERFYDTETGTIIKLAPVPETNEV